MKEVELDISFTNCDATPQQLQIAEEMVRACEIDAGNIFLNKLYNQILFFLRHKMKGLVKTTMNTYNTKGEMYNIVVDLDNKKVIKS